MCIFLSRLRLWHLTAVGCLWGTKSHDKQTDHMSLHVLPKIYFHHKVHHAVCRTNEQNSEALILYPRRLHFTAVTRQLSQRFKKIIQILKHVTCDTLHASASSPIECVKLLVKRPSKAVSTYPITYTTLTLTHTILCQKLCFTNIMIFFGLFFKSDIWW